MRHPDNVEVGVATHTGRVRSANEDDFLLLAPQDLREAQHRGWFVAIADGMGGAPGGAEASRTAVRAAVRPFLDRSAARGPVEKMRKGFAEATQDVYELSRENPNLRDMGTTLTIVNLLSDRLVLGHVGDTRCLRIRNGQLRQLSEDHAVREPESFLTRCVGASQLEVEADVLEFDLREDDRILLMSDGLWGVVPKADISRLAQSLAPQEAADELVRLANENGGPDNSTLVIVHVLSWQATDTLTEVELPAEESRQPAMLRKPDRGLMPPRWPWALLVVGLLLLLIGVAKVVYDVDLVAAVGDLMRG